MKTFKDLSIGDFFSYRSIRYQRIVSFKILDRVVANCIASRTLQLGCFKDTTKVD